MLGLLPWAAQAQAPAGGTTPSLGTVLNADGTLRPGGAGSFDATGYRMKLDSASGQPTFRPAGADDDTWQDGFGMNGADGIVRAVARAANGDLYVGGEFTIVGAVAARGIARWNGTAWSGLGNGTAPATSINNGVSSSVNALAVLGNDLYVGGLFSQAYTVGGPVAVNGVAKWNGTAWSGLGNGSTVATYNNNGVGVVYALAVLGTDLYVGGSFTTAYSASGSMSVNRVAKWNGTSWSGLGNGTAVATSTNNGVNNTVNALAVLGTDLYVGGRFTDASSASGSVPTRFVARWDGSAWNGMGNGSNVATVGNNGVNNVVNALAVLNNELYVGGQHTAANGTSGTVAASRIAKWDGVSWSRLSSGLATLASNGVNTSVNALAVLNNELYVGGTFNAVANASTSVPANNLAKWDGTTWSGLGNGTAPVTSTNNGTNNYVTALAVLGNDLYVGGAFNAVASASGPATINYVAKWDGAAWSSLGSGLNGADGYIRAVARAANGDLYVGGDFTSVGPVAANRVARWNGRAWSALGNGSAPATSTNNGVSRLVYALAVLGNDLYVGGSFTTAYTTGGPVETNNIARWDGTAWSGLGNGSASANIINNGANSSVYALAVLGNDLYLGGSFTAAYTTGGSVRANNIVKWDGAAWSGLGNGSAAATSTNNGVNSSVNVLAVLGTDLYMGGNFTAANSASAIVLAQRIVKWDGTAWSALGNGSATATSTNNGVSSLVDALAVLDNNLYVGGLFSTATNASGPVPVNSIAKWNGTTWSALGNGASTATSFNNGVNGTVHALAAWGNELYVGGHFSTVNTASSVTTVNRLAKWNGSAWSAVGTGLNNGVEALLVTSSQIVAGGYFTTVGDGSKVTVRIAIYGAPPPRYR
ncbi:beta strand repeat-containing protein [Hymenobacter cellulosilyticus]|uniref:Uncharacterized protein n=1 Tax=Hymenobacter cellulosilyticus TaxID=2932248 RepID=A0A8T9QCZ6_9BACT|nr:hypothetical protein [Hymenobacter cellulosilyticus]UOQ73710.1 hypothetical protein MUN79_07255 [Hymenobacter cellulosilyticus]